MPREDRQLVMLRFVREMDHSVDYAEFLSFCTNKVKTRERLTMGLTGALVTGKLSRTVRDRKFASTLPAQGAVGE
ncbi:unnamed protein product, partial [Sphacelaria rigidula]